MCLGNSNRRTNVNPPLQFLTLLAFTKGTCLLEKRGSHMSPWIHTDDLARIAPLWEWTNLDGGMGEGVIRGEGRR